jgi:WD40 repeat protein
MTGHTVAELRGHRDAVKSASFAQDQGHVRVLTASFDKTAQIFDCTVCRSAKQLMTYAMRRTKRRLTAEERALYLPWTSHRRWFSNSSKEG